MVLVAMYVFFRLAIASQQNTRSILGDKDIRGTTRNVFQYIVRGKKLSNKILLTILYFVMLLTFAMVQILRGGVWGAFAAVSTAGAAMVSVACNASGPEAFVKLGKYLLCSLFEAWERMKPSGRPLPPFCQ